GQPPASCAGLQQMPQEQQLRDGQGLASFAGQVLAEGVGQRGAAVEGQLLPDGLLHDPAVLAGRITVDVQGAPRPAVAVADQLQVNGPPVVVGEYVRQFGVLD